MTLSARTLIGRVRGSRFLRDSSWAVFGNGAGYALLLLSGVLIARFLGKDVYGEYGFVKTTMLQFAAFSTLGLGYTSTKFVAERRAAGGAGIREVVRASMRITLTVSCAIALLLVVFAGPLAEFLNASSLRQAFRVLGAIVVLRAVATTQAGLLAGFGDFRRIAVINVSSGAFMLASCVPLTYFLGLRGSLLALAMSQFLTVALNAVAIRRRSAALPPGGREGGCVGRITRFSLPVAMQELTFALARWLGILVVTKLSSLGEVGIYTACEMWNSVILTVPMMLSNVVLSRLSLNAGNARRRSRDVSMMLVVNLLCTLVPLVVVFASAGRITEVYGPTFAGMEQVMRVLVFSAVFSSCSNVFSSELIAAGSTWTLFAIRGTRDAITVVAAYTLISAHGGHCAARDFAICTLVMAAAFFVVMYVYYRHRMAKAGQQTTN